MFTTLLLILICIAVYYYLTKPKTQDTPRQTTGSKTASETPEKQNTSDDRKASGETVDKQAEIHAVKAFPYPPKTPGDCRFPDGDNIYYQDYGEEQVEMAEEDFNSWWFFHENENAGISQVGMDRQNRCVLMRRYKYGDVQKWTITKRWFLIKRNIMASCFALALMGGDMDRNTYKELIAKLDRQVPPTGNPEIDGPEVLLPPQELLDTPSEEERKEAERETESQTIRDKVIWKDSMRKLFFDGDTLKLHYHGTDYFFSGNGYEPMAIILDKNGEVAYIHNSFIVEEECREFIKKPKYLCRTITGHYHNAEHFCKLLTTAIDSGYDWQINDLESEMFSLERFAQREMFYNADGIEFGIYGYEIQDEIDPSELDDDEPKTHFEYDVMYIIVDGKEYHLHDADMKRLGQLGIFEKGCRKPKIRINGTKGSVIAAYTDEWRSGKDFTPFGFPCNTKMFCQMMAYAIRTGKLEYQMQKLASIVAGEPTAPEADNTIYKDGDTRLYIEDGIACLEYRGRMYHFGYDGREPFATISGSNIYVIIRQGENVDATCRYFQNHPEGTIETITGRKLDVAHFCKLLCAAVAHDHGQDSDIEYYMDALERKAFELEDYRERRKKMEEESAKP